MFLALLVFFKIAVAAWGLLWFHTNFRIVCFISMKNAIGILIRIALNLYIALSSMNILTLLFFSINEYRISYHLFVFSVSFINVL